jgi:hypothetical protein
MGGRRAGPTEIEASGQFDSVTTRSYQWTLEYTAGGVLQLLQALPEYRTLTLGRRARLFADVVDVIGKSRSPLRIDYQTGLYFGRRVD